MSNFPGRYAHPLAPRWEGTAWTGETLDDILSPDDGRIAGGLRTAGIGRGDVVAWQLPNGPEAVGLFRACWRLGAVAAPIHHLAGPAEVTAMLGRLQPKLFLGPDETPPSGPERRTAEASPGDLAVVLGTSGSTGTPKLALHTHRGLVYKARVMAAVHGLDERDCVLMPAPFAHISGLLNGVLLAATGMRVVPMARWGAERALEIIQRERVTFMVGPPTFFIGLVDAPGFEPARVESLRLISCGGAGVTPAFVEATSAALGCRVKRTYGSTEAPTVTTWGWDDPPERASTTDGRPTGAAEIRVEDGELWVRGPEVCEGYDDPAATAAAFTPDGWFRTGDRATIDDGGWLTIVGRLKDVIIRGGENIAAGEIEAVLEAHPHVRQAAVLGLPDRRLGERVCAVVVAGRPFDLAECRRWFASRGVTRFRWPERVEQVAELPLLPSGKVDQAALRGTLLAL